VIEGLPVDILSMLREIAHAYDALEDFHRRHGHIVASSMLEVEV
jgi:hypothetical protein